MNMLVNALIRPEPNPNHSTIFSLFLVGFLALLFFSSCAVEPDTNSSQIQFLTNLENYSSTDSIIVSIVNDSTAEFSYGLRCGGYLEMDFQHKENGEWAEREDFWYMSLKCLTKIDTLFPGDRYQTEIPASWLKGIGTYRLKLAVYYSNSFYVE